MTAKRPMPQPDWGIGEYEHTAAELEPVSRRVVEAASIRPGERVLDIACGTGNAALLAAATGAKVTGLDGSSRLVDVARSRATAAGAEASFVVADLQELPFADGSFDVALSIFGVIFAAQPDGAASELVRVLSPSGRGLVTIWIPEGAIDAMAGIGVRAVQAATGTATERFPWSNRAAVSELFGRHGAAVEFDEASVAFAGGSPEAYFARFHAAHPMQLWARSVLERAGTYEQVREQMIAALRDGNEDPEAFRVTSRYLIARIRPQ